MSLKSKTRTFIPNEHLDNDFVNLHQMCMVELKNHARKATQINVEED